MLKPMAIFFAVIVVLLTLIAPGVQADDTAGSGAAARPPTTQEATDVRRGLVITFRNPTGQDAPIYDYHYLVAIHEWEQERSKCQSAIVTVSSQLGRIDNAVVGYSVAALSKFGPARLKSFAAAVGAALDALSVTHLAATPIIDSARRAALARCASIPTYPNHHVRAAELRAEAAERAARRDYDVAEQPPATPGRSSMVAATPKPPNASKRRRGRSQ